MWLGVVSCPVSGAWYFSEVSIELSVATRHRRDTIEKLFKTTLNQNKQTNKQTKHENLNKVGATISFKT